MVALRLVTDGGRRVAKVTKAKRLAATSATAAAVRERLKSASYTEAIHVLAAAMEAKKLADAVFSACCSDDPMVTRALAREASIASGYAATRLSNWLSMIEHGDAVDLA